MTIGIIAAMPDEIALLKQAMQVEKVHRLHNREYVEGKLNGVKSVLVLSRVGKVSAAVTTSILLERFNIDKVIFTGVAGSGNSRINVGDIVIADGLVQHDLDASPLFPRYEVPLLGISVFKADVALSAELKEAAQQFIQCELQKIITPDLADAFSLHSPQLHVGTIASGDQFIKDSSTLKSIENGIRELDISPLSCVEMEGASAAQVCYEMNTPIAVIRTISDNANSTAAIDFEKFLSQVASHYTNGIIKTYLSQLVKAG